ncbi:hypothetical protein NLJ89_g10363 [Agrocybe chaxingu]|uniref:Uncharacterized protein n=1 Tax=Agrocybe chaxingu TaxID=84603 RepID=A0A9W8JYA8_9AGAR|nr:hypothetical protein NLJ89_g10363 [Agrocybe chaxingu]
MTERNPIFTLPTQASCTDVAPTVGQKRQLSHISDPLNHDIEVPAKRHCSAEPRSPNQQLELFPECNEPTEDFWVKTSSSEDDGGAMQSSLPEEVVPDVVPPDLGLKLTSAAQHPNSGKSLYFRVFRPIARYQPYTRIARNNLSGASKPIHHRLKALRDSTRDIVSNSISLLPLPDTRDPSTNPVISIAQDYDSSLPQPDYSADSLLSSKGATGGYPPSLLLGQHESGFPPTDISLVAEGFMPNVLVDDEELRSLDPSAKSVPPLPADAAEIQTAYTHTHVQPDDPISYLAPQSDGKDHSSVDPGDRGSPTSNERDMDNIDKAPIRQSGAHVLWANRATASTHQLPTGFADADAVASAVLGTVDAPPFVKVHPYHSDRSHALEPLDGPEFLATWSELPPSLSTDSVDPAMEEFVEAAPSVKALSHQPEGFLALESKDDGALPATTPSTPPFRGVNPFHKDTFDAADAAEVHSHDFHGTLMREPLDDQAVRRMSTGLPSCISTDSADAGLEYVLENASPVNVLSSHPDGSLSLEPFEDEILLAASPELEAAMDDVVEDVSSVKELLFLADGSLVLEPLDDQTLLPIRPNVWMPPYGTPALTVIGKQGDGSLLVTLLEDPLFFPINMMLNTLPSLTFSRVKENDVREDMSSLSTSRTGEDTDDLDYSTVPPLRLHPPSTRRAPQIEHGRKSLQSDSGDAPGHDSQPPPPRAKTLQKNGLRDVRSPAAGGLRQDHATPTISISPTYEALLREHASSAESFGDVLIDAVYRDLASSPEGATLTRHDVAMLLHALMTSFKNKETVKDHHDADDEPPSAENQQNSRIKQKRKKKSNYKHVEKSEERTQLCTDVRQHLFKMMKRNARAPEPIPINSVGLSTVARFLKTGKKKDGPNRRLLEIAVDFGGLTEGERADVLIWNKQAARVFLKDFKKQNFESAQDVEDSVIIDRFMRHISTTLSKQFLRSIGEETKSGTEKASLGRRRGRKDRRLHTCKAFPNHSVMQHFGEVIDDAPYTFCSGDETDPESPPRAKRLFIKKRHWIADWLYDWARTLDHLGNWLRFPDGVQANAGNFPFPRVFWSLESGTDSEDLWDSSEPIKGLPINVYRDSFWQGLSEDMKLTYKAKPPMPQTFPADLQEFANAARDVVNSKTPPKRTKIQTPQIAKHTYLRPNNALYKGL